MIEWYMLALYAAAFATFSTILDKKLLFKEHALEYAATWGITTFLISLILFSFKLDFNFPYYLWFILILVSLINTAGIIFLTKAFRHLEISVASPLMGFEPAFVVLLAFLFLGETINYQQMWGLVLILFGGYLLEIRKEKFSLLQPIKEAVNSKYVHYAFLAILFYSVSSIITRYVINENSNYEINVFTYSVIVRFFAALFLLIILSILYDGIQGVKNGVRKIGWLLLPASLFSIGHGILTLIAISIPSANVGLVLAIKRISIFFETLIGGELFHDHNLTLKIIASVIMILGTYLIIA